MIQECDRRKIFPKDWKRLNVLWCIYYSQDMENLEKMQNIILKSQDISAYLTPVDERLKREERPVSLLFCPAPGAADHDDGRKKRL